MFALMQSLYRPQAGTVTLDDVPLEEFERNSLFGLCDFAALTLSGFDLKFLLLSKRLCFFLVR